MKKLRRRKKIEKLKKGFIGNVKENNLWSYALCKNVQSIRLSVGATAVLVPVSHEVGNRRYLKNVKPTLRLQRKGKNLWNLIFARYSMRTARTQGQEMTIQQWRRWKMNEECRNFQVYIANIRAYVIIASIIQNVQIKIHIVLLDYSVYKNNVSFLLLYQILNSTQFILYLLCGLLRASCTKYWNRV